MTISRFRPNYESSSPYYLTPMIGKYLTYYIHRPIRPHPQDREFEIIGERYVNRPDLLATDIYNDPDLWWVIPVRNGLEDPIFDLSLGLRLVIPTEAYIRSIL